MVKNSPALARDSVGTVGGEDPLEEEMAALSSIFARRIPWIEKPGGLQFMELQRVKHE